MITVTVLRLFVCVFFIFMETVSVRLFDCLSQAVTDRQTRRKRSLGYGVRALSTSIARAAKNNGKAKRIVGKS